MDTIEFNQVKYPVREVYVEGFGTELIAQESLENALVKDGMYISSAAKDIDNSIFYYVSDKEFYLPEDKLGDLILKELGECPEDQTVFCIETDEDGERFVHVCGYGYYVGEPEDKPYRILDYCGLIAPLGDVIKMGLEEFEEKYGPEVNQYIKNVSLAELCRIYTHYDNGNAPIPISELDLNTPDGCYLW